MLSSSVNIRCGCWMEVSWKIWISKRTRISKIIKTRILLLVVKIKLMSLCWIVRMKIDVNGMKICWYTQYYLSNLRIRNINWYFQKLCLDYLFLHSLRFLNASSLETKRNCPLLRGKKPKRNKNEPLQIVVQFRLLVKLCTGHFHR